MVSRIHIMGASGSGTTTLAKALSNELGYKHFDTDDYYWIPSEIPFTRIRDIEERQSLLKKDLEKYDNWILSGSLCGWGDILISHFELVIYLWIPRDIRIRRLTKREKERYGSAIEPGGNRYESSNEFIEWAAKYDEAGVEMRSKKLHEIWLSRLECPILRIERDMTVKECVNVVMNII
ncbi:MAG: AAA family ATPase [Methanosarcina sp.]